MVLWNNFTVNFDADCDADTRERFLTKCQNMELNEKQKRIIIYENCKTKKHRYGN